MDNHLECYLLYYFIVFEWNILHVHYVMMYK